MNFYDIRNYAQIGQILEKADKMKFVVSAIKIMVSADRTEEISVKDFSDDFRETISNALNKEQKYIKDSLIKFINISDKQKNQ